MAYTNAWDETVPPDSEAANTLANNIRTVEKNIRERMDDVFTDASGTWAASGPANPVVPSAVIKGNVTGKKAIIHHSAFMDYDISFLDALHYPPREHARGRNNALYFDASITALAPAYSVWAPLILPMVPTAVTVTNVDFLIDTRSNSNNMTVKFGYNDYTITPTTTYVGTISWTTTGIKLLSIAAGLPHLVLVDKVYFLEVVMVPDPTTPTRLYGARVTYNTPD